MKTLYCSILIIALAVVLVPGNAVFAYDVHPLLTQGLYMKSNSVGHLYMKFNTYYNNQTVKLGPMPIYDVNLTNHVPLNLTDLSIVPNQTSITLAFNSTVVDYTVAAKNNLTGIFALPLEQWADMAPYVVGADPQKIYQERQDYAKCALIPLVVGLDISQIDQDILNKFITFKSDCSVSLVQKHLVGIESIDSLKTSYPSGVKQDIPVQFQNDIKNNAHTMKLSIQSAPDSLNLIPPQDRQIHLKFFDANTTNPVGNVTFVMIVTKGNQTFLQNAFWTQSGSFTLNLKPGERYLWAANPDHDPIDSLYYSKGDQIDIATSYLTDDVYHFSIQPISVNQNDMSQQNIGGKFEADLDLLSTYNETLAPDANIASSIDPLKIPSPLEQFKSGIAANDVKCEQGLQLVIKSEDNSPACMKLQTASKLVQRGWALNYAKLADKESIVLSAYDGVSNESFYPNGTIASDFAIDVNIDNFKPSNSSLVLQVYYGNGILYKTVNVLPDMIQPDGFYKYNLVAVSDKNHPSPFKVVATYNKATAMAYAPIFAHP